jgi:Calx-beta domain
MQRTKYILSVNSSTTIALRNIKQNFYILISLSGRKSTSMASLTLFKPSILAVAIASAQSWGSTCEIGYFDVAGGSACVAASPGNFVPIAGADAQTPAPVGSFVSSSGASQALLCAVGSYTSSSGNSTCNQAPVGSYVNSTGSSQAQQCAMGTFTSSTGRSACNQAPAGSFVSSTGASGVEQCAVGTYTATAGSSVCSQAPAGSFVATIGASQVTVCSVGTFAPTAGSTNCQLAPAGSFVVGTGATEVQTCPPGTSSAPGAGQCLSGEFGSVSFSAADYNHEENAGQLTVTVIRSGDDRGEFSVDYALQDLSASASADYQFQSGTLVFADGVTNQTINIDIVDDSLYEGDEQLSITLDNIVGNALPGQILQATITIKENDLAPVAGVVGFEYQQQQVSENDSRVTLNILRALSSSGEVSVSYHTLDQSAIAGYDYTASAGRVTFLDGESSKTITVNLLDNNLFESREEFIINLSNLQGDAALASASTTVSIADDDALPISGVFEFELTDYNVDENSPSLTLNVLRVGGSSEAGSVDINSVDGVAISGEDYQAVNQTLSFASGETAKSLSLLVNDDSRYEGSESFSLRLSNGVGAAIGDQSIAIVTIREDDTASPLGQLQFSAEHYQIDESAVILQLSITRSHGSAGQVSVDVSAIDGTATVNDDYEFDHITVTFLDGQVSQTVPVTILDNSQYDAAKSFIVSLSNISTGADMGALSTALVTIVDDEPVPQAGVLQLSGSVYRVKEEQGIVTLTVIRTQASNGDASVQYEVFDAAAVNGEDYVVGNGTLYFSDGEIAKTIEVEISEDDLDEDVESFSVKLSNPEAAVLGRIDQAIVSIENSSAELLTTPTKKQSGGGGGAASFYFFSIGFLLLFLRKKFNK